MQVCRSFPRKHGYEGEATVMDLCNQLLQACSMSRAFGGGCWRSREDGVDNFIDSLGGLREARCCVVVLEKERVGGPSG